MDKSGTKPIIGILGGIGSGKSTVAREFGRLGCAVIDADSIAGELLDTPGVKEEVVSHFGQSVLDETGAIDRAKLAEEAFSNAEMLSKLNSILHPLVLEQTEELITIYQSDPGVKGIVIDMPLLMEVGFDNRCDGLIFVDCEEKVRLARSASRGRFAQAQIKKREIFQISLDNKRAVADNVISNNSDFSALAEQVAEIFTKYFNNG